MLKKLLKHDMVAVARIWWLIPITTLILTVAGSLFLNLGAELMLRENYSTFAILLTLAGTLSMIAVISSAAATMLLVYYRFYKSLFTDEGYLTFTLPVSRKTVLFSKTLNAMIWSILHGILMYICLAIFVLISTESVEYYDLATLFLEPFKLLGATWDMVGAWSIAYIIEAVIIIIGALFFSVAIVQLSITFGAIIARKYKLLAAIGIYYGINATLALIGEGTLLVALLLMGDFLFEFLMNLSDDGVCLFVAAVLLVIFAIIALLGLITYKINRRMLERKLNLT